MKFKAGDRVRILHTDYSGQGLDIGTIHIVPHSRVKEHGVGLTNFDGRKNWFFRNEELELVKLQSITKDTKLEVGMRITYPASGYNGMPAQYLGQTATVTQVRPDSKSQPVRVKFDDGHVTYPFVYNGMFTIETTTNKPQQPMKEHVFKVGDRVKIVENSRYYDQGSSNPIIEGSISEVRTSGDFTYQVKWDNNNKNSYRPQDLELVQQSVTTSKPTTPVKVTLENASVETVDMVLQQAIVKKAEELKIPVDSALKDRKYTYLYFDGATLHGGSYPQHVTVDIPVFLVTMKEYSEREKLVEIILSDGLTATIIRGKSVKITGVESRNVSLAVIASLKEALATPVTPKHRLQKGDWVNPGDSKITEGLLAMAKIYEIPGAHKSDYDQYPVLTVTNSLELDTIDMGSGFRSNRIGTELTVAQFVEKIVPQKAEGKELPKLASRTPTLNDIGSLTIGCQTISKQALEELFKAVEDANA